MSQNSRPKSSRAPPSVSFTLSTLTVTFVTDHVDESKTAQREEQHATAAREEAQNAQQTAPSTSRQSGASDVAGDVQAPETKHKCNCRYLWSCSLHGLNQFMQARCRCSKILWGLLILACLGISAYTTRMVFTDYIDNETATLVTIRQIERLQLPSIILCPKNP
ncbi:CBN-Na+ channel, partial [Aphelenchoides avenae]